MSRWYKLKVLVAIGSICAVYVTTICRFRTILHTWMVLTFLTFVFNRQYVQQISSLGMLAPVEESYLFEVPACCGRESSLDMPTKPCQANVVWTHPGHHSNILASTVSLWGCVLFLFQLKFQGQLLEEGEWDTLSLSVFCMGAGDQLSMKWGWITLWVSLCVPGSVAGLSTWAC